MQEHNQKFVLGTKFYANEDVVATNIYKDIFFTNFVIFFLIAHKLIQIITISFYQSNIYRQLRGEKNFDNVTCKINKQELFCVISIVT